MFTDSIRWRMQLWLALLLVGVLVAFGATSWQLEKTERIRRLDDELAKRATALGVGVRGGGMPFQPGRMNRPDDIPRGPGPGGNGGPGDSFDRGGPGNDDGPEGPVSFDPSSGPDGPGGPRDRSRGPGGPGGPGGSGGSGRRPPPPPDWGVDGEFAGNDDGGPFGGGGPPALPENRVPAEVEALFPGNGAEGYYYSVWTGMSGTQRKSAKAPAEVPLPESDGRNTQLQFRDRDGVREAYHFTERGECVLAGRPVHTDLAGMRPYAWRLSATGFVVLAIGLGGGWILTSRSIRPIEKISASARRISDGDLSERIPVGRQGNELNQLAGVLNDTFARLEDSFAQQKRFTADASHELRTPLTVLITETQSALSRERSGEEYREALTGNLETARQMKRLAEALLDLARMDGQTDSAEATTFDLAELGADMMLKLKPLAVERGTRLSANLQPALAKGHPDRLELVIKNLIDNAIHHGKHSGSIEVRSWQDGDKVFLSVADDGPGIAVADLPHLFERFYRADKSRTGSKGRYGLGLAICKGLVEAEGGTISVESRKGEGACFTVSLPLGS